MLGRHRQIIEVQCAPEVYGKGAYPYYIGQGVIDGWEEYEWLMYPTDPKGLRDVVNHPLYAGLWTWSLGGGWDGPYIKNDFWPKMNAFVMKEYAKDTRKTEPEIFAGYARSIGLSEADAARLREMCLLSSKAVLRGQCTTLGASIDPWWNRDDKMDVPDLSDFIAKGLVEKSIAEKWDSVPMWTRMEEIARQIAFSDQATKNFVVTSCVYGRFKYAVAAAAWELLLLGKLGENSGKYDKPRIEKAFVEYDDFWTQWRRLETTNPSCSTIYHDYGYAKGPGVGAALARLRQQIS
jgi:hypothetical protein